MHDNQSEVSPAADGGPQRLQPPVVALGELRRRLGVSQSVVADAMGTTQSSVSRVERQPDILLSTLRDYVGGLGGHLRLFADIHAERFELNLPAARQASGSPSGREFRVVWQDPQSRGLRQVGWLRFDEGRFAFTYTDEARDNDQFAPFPSFPDLDEEYESKELFPFFAGRVLSATNPRFDELASALGLTRKTATPVELLALGQADSPHDTIQVVPEPIEHPDGTVERTFLASGVRHANEDDPGRVSEFVATLGEGDPLELMLEPTNPKNPDALQLASQGVIVGWVPNYLLDEVHAQLRAKRQLRVEVLRANSEQTPWHLRLLCRMTSSPAR